MKTTDSVIAIFITWGLASSAIALPAKVLQPGSVKSPLIALDPGHSGHDIKSVDRATGLIDHDYPNHPEMEECFRIAKAVQAKLAQKGYRVVCTKEAVADSVSLHQRAKLAQEAQAALGISIHDDHSKKFSTFAQVYAQNVGLWRGRTVEKPKAVFSDGPIAARSRIWAQIFAAERTRAEGHKVEVTSISFNGRHGIEPGNIPQVALYAGSGAHPVPWIYNEVGGIGLGPEEEAKYVQGLVNSIEKCVPILTK